MRRAVILIAAALSGCPHQDGDSYRKPPEPPDTDRCSAGCANLAKLGCEEAKGSDPGDPASCKNDCEYVQREGLVFLNPGCWARISDCSEIETTCRK